MRSAIDWSFELLDPTAQRLLGRLAIFSGSFTLEAMIAVGGPRPAVEQLDALVCGEHRPVAPAGDTGCSRSSASTRLELPSADAQGQRPARGALHPAGGGGGAGARRVRSRGLARTPRGRSRRPPRPRSTGSASRRAGACELRLAAVARPLLVHARLPERGAAAPRAGRRAGRRTTTRRCREGAPDVLRARRAPGRLPAARGRSPSARSRSTGGRRRRRASSARSAISARSSTAWASSHAPQRRSTSASRLRERSATTG